MPRVFLAIPLDDITRSAMSSLSIPERDALRRVRADELHVTLHFLGEVPDSRLQDLRSSLRQLRAASFTLRFCGAGRFGSNNRSEILWAGVVQNPLLVELHTLIGHCLQTLNMAVEDRPYSPHLTIARMKTRSPEIAEQFIRMNSTFQRTMPVDQFCLFRSCPNTSGCRYQIIESFPLSAS